jgi:DNA polymerase-3 subunit gamma/tau
MSYQVLARKWRPQKFSDVVGQQHVLAAIANGLSLGRIHHAYLFSGTRGVGKTSIARLLAKGLNCESGITATPCGKCDNCREIEEGRFVDLIEIDAASRTKVEDTRDILDNVQYAPARGRFKVYLIDEVHMLSRHSFNALLKTLEEPPEHVKFLLATTDPQKLPITILSRCLQFHLKALDVEQIRIQLEKILQAEHIPAENKALQLLARSADGSMRDALSLTDQAIAMGNGQVDTSTVSEMLGTLDDEQPLGLVEALMNADGEAVMAQIETAASRGFDWENLLVETLAILHQVAMIQLLPSMPEPSSNEQRLRELARQISPQDLQLYYQTLLTGRKELAYAPDRRSGIEMTFLRALAFHPKPLPVVDENTPFAAERQTTDVKVNVTQQPATNVSQPKVQQPTANEKNSPASPTVPPLQAERTTDEASLSGPMAQLLQARNQLQQRSQQNDAATKGGTAGVKGNGAKQPSSPLERLVSAVDNHAKSAKGKVADAAPVKKESYRWKAQNPEQQANKDIPVTPKLLRTALEHEKTPELIEKLAEESMLRDEWANEIHQLTLPKLVQQLALNAFKEQVSADEVRLHLRSAQKHLNNKGALDALSEAMHQHNGRPIVLSIVEDDDKSTRTPLEWRQVIYEEKLAQARRSLSEDEYIQTICRFFDAELDEESIRPV